jgi:hypothetical protein
MHSPARPQVEAGSTYILKFLAKMDLLTKQSTQYEKELLQQGHLTEQFTQHEKDSLREVHAAIQNKGNPSRLASICNQTLFENEKLLGFAEALITIIKANNMGCDKDNAPWRVLQSFVKQYTEAHAGLHGQHTKKSKERRTRIKQTMVVSMQWTLDILAHYEWDAWEFSRDRLAHMCNCAQIYPQFKDDFVPQVNFVRWLKHCTAVSDLEKRGGKEDDLAPFNGGEFAVKDLFILKQLKKDKPTHVYGRDITLDTASKFQRDIRKWTDNHDGMVKLDGKERDLKKLRPDHWNMLLLKFDDNGLLVRRRLSDRVATPCREGIPSPPTSMLVPMDRDERLQTRSASAISVSASSVSGGLIGSVPSDPADSVSGSVSDVGDVAGRSANSPADSVAEATAAHATSPTQARIQNGLNSHKESVLVSTPIAPPDTDDGSSEEQGSNYQEVGDELMNDKISQDRDPDDEGPSDRAFGESSATDVSVEEPLGSTTSDMGQGTHEKRALTQNPSTGEPDIWIPDLRHGDGQDMRANEVDAVHGNNTPNSVDEPNESHISAGAVVGENSEGIARWLVGQHWENPLFVRGSQSVSPPGSEAPEVPLSGQKGVALSPATLELSRASLARTVVPQSVATQRVGTKLSSDTTNSPTASESSSELTRTTVRGWRSSSSSSECSSRDDYSPYGASSDSSSVAEAWPSREFTSMGAVSRITEVPAPLPHIFAPYIPGMIPVKSIENGGYEFCHGGQQEYRKHYSQSCSEGSPCSYGTSQDLPDLLHCHSETQPGSCMCETCGEIVLLLERVYREASSDNATESSRACNLWFSKANWASVAGGPDEGEPDFQRDHEVVVVDSTSFRKMAGNGSRLHKPILINEHHNKQDVYGVEAVEEALRDSYGSLKTTMTSALADVPTLVGWEEFLKRFSSNEWSIGTSTPRDSFGTQHPAFLSYRRFRLLQNAVTRASCHPEEMSGAGARCDDITHALCVNGGLSFNRVESRGAFSGPHLGPLGGTWLRVLEGRRLCAFVPYAKLTASFDGGLVRMVLLEPGDVFLLPPNFAYAQFAVDRGVSLEGSFWDELEWGRYFAAAQWAAMDPTHVTPQIPWCATRLALLGLKDIARDKPQLSKTDPFAQKHLENDSSGVFEMVMARRCSKLEECGTQGLEDVMEVTGSRRKSDAQTDSVPNAKRMCIRR